jgi:hypothetical protein
VVSSKVPLDTPLKNTKVEIMDDVPDSPSIKRSKSKRVEGVPMVHELLFPEKERDNPELQ